MSSSLPSELPERMRAMVLPAAQAPLQLTELAVPVPGPGQVLLRVRACGVCRTDLHIADGEVIAPQFPLVLGHQIVAERADTGQRVGVPWLGWTDGTCRYCLAGEENLCDHARFTGLDIPGGFAEWTVADERFCLPLPDAVSDTQAAPLLCAGLIGYRTLRLAGDPHRLGIYGFGSAAHLICQLAVKQGREVYAITRPGDHEGQALARSVGAVWAGGNDEPVPQDLDAALIFAPAGELVPLALKAVRKGGSVVCGGIHMTDIPAFPYASLWGERVLRSVANLTRQDGLDLLAAIARTPITATVTTYPLEQAQTALDDLRSGRLVGSAVLSMA